MRIKFIRSFPEIWARIMWPLPMSTWNVVLGRDSVTTPSSSIISSFAKRDSLLEGGQRPSQFPVRHRFSLFQLLDGGVVKGAVRRGEGLHMPRLFRLGMGRSPSLSVGQQQPAGLLFHTHDAEDAFLVPSGSCPDDLPFVIRHRLHPRWR